MSNVGRLIRIEWDEKTKQMRVILEITDPDFKRKVLNSKKYLSTIVLKDLEVFDDYLKEVS